MSKANMVEDAKQENTEKKKGKKWGILAIVLVVLLMAGVGAAVGIGIYNAPENRLTRQLEFGYKYLEEGDYEKAALAFEQVIAVDKKCIEAYAKGIEAYIKSGNKESLKDLFERAMEQIGELDEELLSQNMEYIVDIYLSVEDVYGDDPSHMAEILEKGLEVTNGNEQIRNLLVNIYLELAESKTGDGLYEEALSVFDRLLELDGGNTGVLSEVADCLNAYIEELMSKERYDEIRALAEKYSQIPGVDFEGVLRKIEEFTNQTDDRDPAQIPEEPEPVFYTVSFGSAGGNAVMPQTVESGNAAAKPKDPVRDGYAFAGWYEDEQTTKMWDFSRAVTADITLYAKWSQNVVYIVSFEVNGGSAVASQNVEAGSRALKPQDPVRAGYRFAGWYADAQTTRAWDFSQTVTADITIYAKWDEQEPQKEYITIAGRRIATDETELDLSDCGISDISELRKMKNLVTLDLRDNNIIDISALSALTSLEKLDLFGNEIENINALSGLTRLRALDLSANRLRDISAVSGLTNLEELDLFDNAITELKDLSKLTRLTELDLGSNQIEDISVLAGLTKLEELDLSNNRIRQIGVLGRLTRLTVLDISGNLISDIDALGGLSELTELKAGANQIDDISALGRLTYLTKLNLSDNQIEDIAVLEGLTELTYLDLSGNRAISAGEFAELEAELPDCYIEY